MTCCCHCTPRASNSACPCSSVATRPVGGAGRDTGTIGADSGGRNVAPCPAGSLILSGWPPSNGFGTPPLARAALLNVLPLTGTGGTAAAPPAGGGVGVGVGWPTVAPGTGVGAGNTLPTSGSDPAAGAG